MVVVYNESAFTESFKFQTVTDSKIADSCILEIQRFKIRTARSFSTSPLLTTIENLLKMSLFIKLGSSFSSQCRTSACKSHFSNYFLRITWSSGVFERGDGGDRSSIKFVLCIGICYTFTFQHVIQT